jgi:fibronectin-binding autotransporter adhesin
MSRRNDTGCEDGQRSGFIAGLLAGILLLGLCSAAEAATYTWDGGGGSNNWSDAVNWSNDVRPISGADTAIAFGSGPRNITNQDISNPFVLNALSFGVDRPYSISGNALDFHASSGSVAPTLSQDSYSSLEIANPLNLTDTLTYGGNGTGPMTLSGKLSGTSAGLNKNNGNSTLTLSGVKNPGPSAISFLAINAGGANLIADVLNLSATGSTGFSGDSSLFVGGGATVTVFGGSTLNTKATPQIQNNGQMTLTGTLTRWSNTPATPGGADEIRVGYAGGASTLTIDASAAVTTGGLRLGNSAFNGYGNLVVTNGGSVQTGTLTLDDATSTITINHGTLSVGAINELTPGAAIFFGNGDFGGIFTISGDRDSTFSGTIQDVPGQSSLGTLVKQGTGALRLSGNSGGFSSRVSLYEGSLGVGSNTALGTGVVNGYGSGQLFASGGDHTLSNAIFVSVGLNLVTVPGDVHNLTLNGLISGPTTGGIVINAPGGTITYGGGSANTFGGPTNVTAGTLVLNKNPNNFAISGGLSIGNAVNPGPAGSVVVRAMNSGQLNGTFTDVSIYSDGLLDASNQQLDLKSLAMTGGEVQMGNAVWGLNGDLTSNASGGSTARITSSGNSYLNLSRDITLSVARGTAQYDLDVQAGFAGHAVTKTGAGILRLAGQFSPGLSVTQNAGTIAAANDSVLGTGGFTFAGGTFVADSGARNFANPVNVTGNATIGSSLDGTPRALTFTGPISLADNTTLTVSNNAATNFSGVIAGAGGILKTGPGTLMLGNTANTFSGGLIFNGGTLAVAGDGSLGSPANLITVNAGRLQFAASTTMSRTFNLSNTVTLVPPAGGTLTYASGAAVNGGFLGAGGTHAFADGSSLNGATAAVGSTLTTSGAVSFTNATLRGTITQSGGTLALTDTTVASAGTLSVGGAVNASGLEMDGVMNVNSGGTLANSGSALVLGGGSRTTVNAGGAVNLQGGTTLEVNGALLTNNGTVSGTTNVHFNGVAVGTGSFGPVNLFENGRFAPGASAAPVFQPAAIAAASATFASNASLAVEIGGKTPGSGFDQVNISGNAVLDGELSITTTNNFSPAPLDSFKIMSFAAHSGHFTSYSGQQVPHGLAYAPVYSATDLKLIATIPGDDTLDGKVDFNDLVRLAQNYDTTLTTDNWWSSGDFTLDGKVDFNDLVKLAQNYGAAAAATTPEIPLSLQADWSAALAAAAGVPEPSMSVVVAITAIGAALVRRPSRSEERFS